METRSSGVSVVVPAYNPGRYLERTIASLLDQTLPRERYEVVFVDDGSTDGTGYRLDELAAQHPDLIRVTHISNSGWPGRPRNVGTDLARFDHVFYCDADDWLPDYGLQTLLERAETDASDLVVARVISNRRDAANAIFEQGDFCTTWRETPAVFTSLLSQKLFRRDFLRERGVRFPEGKVRLEDFIFMMQALLQSERISVLGSRPCYVLEKRHDSGNLTATAADVDDYLDSVERILDVIEAHTEPGAERDLALDRTLRTELTRPANSPNFLRRDEAERIRVFDRVGRILRDRIPGSAIARLNATTRRRVRAIMEGDRRLIEEWIGWDDEVRADVRISGATWSEGRLQLDMELAFRRRGAVIRLSRVGERLFAPGPPALEPDEPGLPAGVDVTAEAKRVSVHVALRRRDVWEKWRVRATGDHASDAWSEDALEMRYTATAELDFRTMANGRALYGAIWDPFVSLDACGLSRKRRASLADGQPEPVPATLDGLAVSPFFAEKRRLSFDVGEAGLALSAELVRRGVTEPRLDKDVLSLRLPLSVHGRAAKFDVQLVPHGPGNPAPLTLPGTVAAGTFPGRLEVPVPDLSAAQRWSVSLRHGESTDGGNATPVGLDIVVARRGAAERLFGRSPSAEVMSTNADRRAARGRTEDGLWQRRLATVARRLGLHITKVGSGAVLLSRSKSGYQSAPLGRGRFHLVGRRRDHDVLTVENEMMQHLGGRHVTWLLDRHRVDCVIDIGVKAGRYALGLRRNGYRGHIVSVVPTSAFVEKAQPLTLGDPKWIVQRAGIDQADGVPPVRGEHPTGPDERLYTPYGPTDGERIETPLRRLDSVLDEWLAPVVTAGVPRPRVFIMAHTRSLDAHIFTGLGARMQDIVGLRSLLTALGGEQRPSMSEAIADYQAAGFEVTGLYPVTRRPDGRAIEYDCTMVRANG